MMSCFGL